VATRSLLRHGIAQRTPVPTDLPTAPVVKNSRFPGSVGPGPSLRAYRPGTPVHSGERDLHAVAGHCARRDPHPVGRALRRHVLFPPWRAALAPSVCQPPRGRAPLPRHAAHAGRDDDLRRDLAAAPKRAQLPRGRRAQRMRRDAAATRAHRDARPPGGGYTAGYRGELAGHSGSSRRPAAMPSNPYIALAPPGRRGAERGIRGGTQAHCELGSCVRQGARPRRETRACPCAVPRRARSGKGGANCRGARCICARRLCRGRFTRRRDPAKPMRGGQRIPFGRTQKSMR